ncbi:MEKHLA domain-containing protein [Streptomyces mirabilis]
MPSVLSVTSPFDPAFVSLLCDSHEALLGKRLAAKALAGVDVASWLYHDAPFAVLAQDASAEPVFAYANTAAQARFAYSWEEFSGMPSRLSAPSVDQEGRQSLMARVARDGYVQGYQGLRVSNSGQLFRIENVTVWNLTGNDGVLRGQAAVIPSWSDA